jgi:hypothetical protein
VSGVGFLRSCLTAAGRRGGRLRVKSADILSPGLPAHPPSRRLAARLGALLLALLAGASAAPRADTVTGFGPRTSTRGTGQPVTINPSSEIAVGRRNAPGARRLSAIVGQNRPPTASAGGPYSGTAWARAAIRTTIG